MLELWLTYLGIDARELGRRLGLRPATVSAAVRRGSRPEWIKQAGLLLDVPPSLLLAIPPDDPRAQSYALRALHLAARRRLDRVRSAARQSAHPHHGGPMPGA